MQQKQRVVRRMERFLLTLSPCQLRWASRPAFTNPRPVYIVRRRPPADTLPIPSGVLHMLKRWFLATCLCLVPFSGLRAEPAKNRAKWTEDDVVNTDKVADF